MAVLLGHTLGTPSLTVLEALDLFAEANLDGAEIIWQDGYKAGIPENDRGEVVDAIKRRAHRLGLTIGCLTPYVTGLNSLDEDVRQRDIARLALAIRVAEMLECPRLRVYGGTLLGDEPPGQVPLMHARLVESLRDLAELAIKYGVVLCVENHFSTMTISAQDTARLVAEVDSRGIGILYDQANLTFTHREPFGEAIQVQAPWIRHVHVKDLEFIDPDRVLTTTTVARVDPENRVHRSRMIGDGLLDWQAIVDRLRAVGYDGSYSLEYEYRWNPEDLPEPASGIPESSRRLRHIVRPVGASPGAAQP